MHNLSENVAPESLFDCRLNHGIGIGLSFGDGYGINSISKSSAPFIGVVVGFLIVCIISLVASS
jgi:hypothetical protein